MKAFRIHDYKSDPIVEDVAVPEPASGEVRVRVAAAALNPLDVKIQGGHAASYFPVNFPYVVGTDLSGTVDALGQDVHGWVIGDRVVARNAPTSGGAVAEFATVPAEQLVRVPEGVGFSQAAGVPTAGATAWQALFETAKLRGGQTVLIHAGAGGVGSFAIQFARRRGARVYTTASGEGIQIAQRLGADLAIDYRNEDFAELVRDVDVVLDTVGGDTLGKSYRVLRAGGFLVSVVATPDEMLAKAHSIHAGFNFHSSDAERLSTVFGEVSSGAEVLIDSVFPVHEARSAFNRQASGRAKGKIILTIE